jgi:phosphoribosylformylglycinamidine cyclo-ligase
LHSNGFSLVRKIVGEHRLDLGAPLAGSAAALGDEMLRPTRIYAPDLLALRAELRRRGLAVRGFAHITGGGLPGNVPRALRDDATARVDPGLWPMPALQAGLAELAGLDPTEARSVWNGGIGMVAIVEPAAVEPALALLAARGLPAWQIGDVIERAGDQRYVEERIR